MTSLGADEQIQQLNMFTITDCLSFGFLVQSTPVWKFFLSRLSTGLLLLKRDEQSSDRINGRIKKTNETSISFLKLLRNITVECRAMKDLLYSVNILTKYQVLGLFKCIFRKPRNFLCNMKLGSRVVAVSSSQCMALSLCTKCSHRNKSPATIA